MTVAEITDYGAVVQFYGDTLHFTWESDSTAHHYRLFLTDDDLTADTTMEANSIHYCQNAEFDISVVPGHLYQVTVQALSAAGDSSAVSNASPQYLCMGGAGDKPVSTPVAALPGETALGPGYPNPFNSTTTIPYEIASVNGAPVDVSLRIYNTLGQVVRNLVDDTRLPGQYRVAWDGRNDYGALVSAGNYICLLQAGDVSATRILIYLK